MAKQLFTRLPKKLHTYDLTTTAISVLVYICEHINHYDDSCILSRSRIALETGITKKSISVSIRALESANLLTVKRGSGHSSSVYKVYFSDRVEWCNNYPSKVSGGGSFFTPLPHLKNAQISSESIERCNNYPHNKNKEEKGNSFFPFSSLKKERKEEEESLEKELENFMKEKRNEMRNM